MSLSRLNPNWQAAKLHGIAIRPGIIEGNKHKSQYLICPCCLNVIYKNQAPLCDNSKQLQFLGFGFPLFYVFLKYCIIMLLITFCCYNALAINTSINQATVNCAKLSHGCTSWMVKFAMIQKSVSSGEIVTRVTSFFIQLCCLIYLRDLVIKTRNYYDQRTTSLSDYSIMVENLPPKQGNKQRIKNFLQDGFNQKYSPTQITLISQYNTYFQLEEYIAQIIGKIKESIGHPENLHHQRSLAFYKKQLAQSEERLHQYCEKEIQLEEADLCIAQKLIFSCQTEDQKWQILNKFEQINQDKLKELFGVAPEDQCRIKMSQAPEPKEISWQQINYPEHKRILRIILGWILTILFLASITVIFFFILSEKASLVSHSEQSDLKLAIVIVYIALISVILFNKLIMGMVLHKICLFELHPTTAQQQFHFAMKYAVGMFFTTALMTLFVEDIRFHNFYEHHYGVIEEETIMFFMNAFFVPLIWLINPWHIYVLLRRKWKYGRKDMTQKEANNLMQNFHYNMGKRYAEILQIMWFTYLYLSLIPIGAAITIVGLILYYWVDKYNLLRRASVTSNIAGELSLYSMELLDLTLIFKPFGEIIFDAQLRDTVATPSIIMAVLGFIYLVLPTNKILQFFHDEKFKNEEKKYSDVEPFFKETYQTLHPIYSLKKQSQQRIMFSINLAQNIINQIIQEEPKDGKEVEFNSFTEVISPTRLRGAAMDLQSLFKCRLPSQRNSRTRLTIQDLITPCQTSCQTPCEIPCETPCQTPCQTT